MEERHFSGRSRLSTTVEERRFSAASTLAIGFSYDTLSGSTPPPAECSMHFNGHFVVQ